MSLTLITAYTSLRVLVGVAGVGYSIYANRIAGNTVNPEDIGKFNFDKIPEAIFGQAIGGIVYDFLKGGTSDSLDQYLQRISAIDPNVLNHDLQRAAAKASLMATYFACQSCLADIKSQRQGFLRKAAGIVWQDADIESLKAVSKNLREEIARTETAIYDDKIDYHELFGIFKETDIADTDKKHEQLAADLKARTIREIETTSYYKFGGHKVVALTENALKLLSGAINDGWEQYVEDKDSIIHLKLSTYGKQIKKHDWFQLLCVIFNEEYKVNEKVEAAIQKQTALEQTALLKQIQERMQSFGRIENFNDLEKQIAEFREENFWLHTITHQKQDTAQESLDRIEAKLDGKMETAPRTVHNLPNLDVKVYGREVEKDELLQALRGETAESQNHPFALIVAPSAFGKTYLLTKALQDVTDGEAIKPEFSTKVKRILLIDCRQIQSLLQIVGEFNTLFGSKLNFDEEAPINQWLNTNLFPLTHQAGEVWLILDNFESWLDDGYQIINEHLQSFLLALFTGNHRMRGVLLSQSEPERDIKMNLNKLEKIGATLYKGLPEADALDYLRTEGAKVNLHKADEKLLKEFLVRVAYIPQALTSLVSYLSDIPDYTFADFMADETFWAAFDKDEHDKTALEKGIRRTKALIARQIRAQSPEVKRLLQALTFFNAPTTREALELLFDNKAQAGNPISRLHSHNLAAVSEDLRGTSYYELHSYFSEQARIALAPIETIAQVDYAGKILNKGNDSYRLNYFTKAISLYESAEKILQYLINQGNTEFENDLASAYMNKGVALASQGKLPEAIVEFDRTIAIRERLVNEENRGELANDLAMAYMNKGNALDSQGKLPEAIVEFDRTIAILERLVNEENRGELANNLAMAYMNKGVALDSQGKLPEAIVEFDRTIAIYERLVNEENRGELANDLAAAYMNKGVALKNVPDLINCLDCFDKGIDWREKCLARGDDYVLPDYVKGLAHRIGLLINLKDYQRAANDILKAFEFINLLHEPDFPDYFKQRIGGEISDILFQISSLPAEKREEIYKYAGEDGEIIRQYVDDFEETQKSS